MVLLLFSSSLTLGAPVSSHRTRSSWDVWHRLCIPAGKGHALDLGKQHAISEPAEVITDEERLNRVRDSVLDAKNVAILIKKLMVSVKNAINKFIIELK